MWMYGEVLGEVHDWGFGKGSSKSGAFFLRVLKSR